MHKVFSEGASDVYISTTVLSWNRKELLERTLYSYRDTIEVPFELFIVDNGSDDDTVKAIEFFCAETPTAKAILLNTNYGGRSLNLGIERSCAPLIHLSDNDVEYLPGWSEYVIKTFDCLPELGQLSLYGPSPSDEEVWEHPHPVRPWYENGVLVYEAPSTNVPTTSVVRRSVFDQGACIMNAPETPGSTIRFPGDGYLSEMVSSLGLRVAWAERYLVVNLGDTYEEMSARHEYYAATYGSKPWLGESGWQQRMESWRTAPRPDRYSTCLQLIDSEMTQPELSLNGANAALVRQWTMVDARTPLLEAIETVHALVRLQKPDLVVEPRAWRGHCSVAIGKAFDMNGSGRGVSLEEDRVALDCTLRRLAYAGCDRVHAIGAGPQEWEPDGQIGMLVLDCYGLEAQEAAAILEYLGNYCTDGATVVLLSTERMLPSVKDVHEKINRSSLRRFGMHTVTIACPRGIVVGRLSRSVDLGA